MMEIWFAFVAGLAGGFHCIGMCGGIVAALSMSPGSTSLRPRALSQLNYNLGRITTYTALGAVCGLLGASLDLVAMRSLTKWVFAGANVFVMIVGLASVLGMNALNFSALEGKGARLLAKPLGRLMSVGTPASAFPLGLLLGFLPCGLVYAPLVVASGTGSPVMGAAIMAAMGVGTLPVLLIFGTASGALSTRLRSWMFRVAGAAVFAMGAAGLWRIFARTCAHCCAS
jgi:hypothetical protein